MIKQLELGKPTEDLNYLIEEVQDYVNDFQNISLASQRSVRSERHEQLDRLGTKLWNLSTKLKREHGSKDFRTVSLVRTFAFLLLDGAQSLERSTPQNVIRLMNAALKTARICLDGGQLGLCQKVLEKAAGYESEIRDPRPKDAEEDEETGALYARLRAGYFVLRTALESTESFLSR